MTSGVKGRGALPHGMINNFMGEDRAHDGVMAHETDNEMGGEPDGHALMVGKQTRHVDFSDNLNDSRLSIMRKLNAKAAQEARFRIFQSMGFQGNPNDALNLICLTLKTLDFVSTRQFADGRRRTPREKRHC